MGTSVSVRRLSKKPVRANFEAQYAVLDGKPNFPEREETTIIFPPVRAIKGKAKRARYTLA